MSLNGSQRTTSLDLSKEQPLLCKDPHTATGKIEVRHNTPYKYLANQRSLLVPDMYAVTASGIHVPGLVALDAIRYSAAAVSKQSPVCESRPAIDDIILVDRGWKPWVE